MGITQPKVSDIMRGDLSNLSERKLMDCLNRPGYDIEIKVRAASAPVGHLKLAIASRHAVSHRRFPFGSVLMSFPTAGRLDSLLGLTKAQLRHSQSGPDTIGIRDPFST